MLSAETAQIPAPPPDSMRRYDLVQAGINRWIRRPRDVARLANALRFAWPALEGEVDPQDLICMEGLRLFDREVYAWIRDQRDLLLNQAFPWSVNQAQQEEIGRRLKESLAEEKRDDVILLLKSLFPSATKIFGKNERSLSQEPWFKIANRRGIATKPAFDAYFSLSPSAHEIPKELVDRAMNALDDEEAQIAYLEEALRRTDAFGNTLLGDYFQELVYRFAERGSNSSQALFNALIRSGDKVFGLDWKGDIFGPAANLHILMIRVLQKLGEAEAARVVEEILSKPGDLITKCGLLVDQARQLGIIPGGGSSKEPALLHADLIRLAETLAPRVEKAVVSGDLDDARAYYDVLRLLGLAGRNDKARAWSAHLALSSPHRLATLTNGFLGYSRTAAGKSYHFAEMPDSEIYDMDAIRRGLSLYCDATDIDDDERARLSAVDRGLSGTSDDD